MTRRWALLAALLVALACQSSAPTGEPVVEPPAAVAEPDAAIGTVRVTATRLNVREGPSTSDTVIATVRRGERVELLATADAWSRIRVSEGAVGWVASRYVRQDKRCSADRAFEIAESPMMTFSDSGAHGLVIVDAAVDASGKVTSTRIVRNDTGDPALGELAATEIKRARFRAPIVNCAARAFIYTYRRTY